MSRNVTSVLKEAAFAQETDQVFLILLEINHSSLAAPIRAVNNQVDIVSNGVTYIGFPFDITLPQDFEDALPSVTLTICNVDRSIVYAIRTVTGPPTVSISVILASNPNTIEAGPFTMTLREASYDSMVVSGMIMAEDVLNEPYPADDFTPANFRGLF